MGLNWRANRNGLCPLNRIRASEVRGGNMKERRFKKIYIRGNSCATRDEGTGSFEKEAISK